MTAVYKSLNLQAERVGFEPTMTTRAITVFETAPFNHSGTSPAGRIITEFPYNSALSFSCG